MFDPDGQPHVTRRDTGRQQVRLGELAVSCAGRMNRQAASISNIRHMIEELQIVDKGLPGGLPTADFHPYKPAVAPLEICVGAPSGLPRLLARMNYVADLRMT